MPQAARERWLSLTGCTLIWPSSIEVRTSSSSTVIERVDFGPLTLSVWPSRFAVTPAGTGTGFLPIRDILEHLRQDFATDVLLTRFRIGKHATRRRDDGHAKAVADPRQLAS